MEMKTLYSGFSEDSATDAQPRWGPRSFAVSVTPRTLQKSEALSSMCGLQVRNMGCIAILLLDERGSLEADPRPKGV
jgi:hypothetical protein